MPEHASADAHPAVYPVWSTAITTLAVGCGFWTIVSDKPDTFAHLTHLGHLLQAAIVTAAVFCITRTAELQMDAPPVSESERKALGNQGR